MKTLVDPKLVQLRMRREQYVARLRMLDRASALLERNLAELESLWSLDYRLIDAAIAGNVREVAKRLQEGADPAARNAEGDPVLLLAASRDGNLAVVRELLSWGAAVDARDSTGNTALIACVRDENLLAVKELVEVGADVNAVNSDGDTPLTNAAAWGSAKVVRYLLSRGADPRQTDGAGVSALQLARQHRNQAVVQILSSQ
jgi:ankyrin repeat protein